jgi:hypothetical protein
MGRRGGRRPITLPAAARVSHGADRETGELRNLTREAFQPRSGARHGLTPP